MSAEDTGTASTKKAEAAYEQLVRRLGSKEQADALLHRQEQRERDRKQRKDALNADDKFVQQKEQVSDELDVAFEVFPDRTKSFLQKFQLPWRFAPEQLKEWLESHPPRLAAAFKHYAEFCQRFGVYFRRMEKSFEWRVIARPGSKFHLIVREGHLQPVVPVPSDEEMADYLEDPTLDVPPTFQQLINEEKIKFVQIDDESGSSALSTLERYTYSDGGVTLVRHGTSPPYLFVLVGERATKELIDDTGKALTAFQRDSFERGKGGRPRNPARHRAYREALTKPGAKKVSAVDIGGDTGVKMESAQSGLSRISAQQRLSEQRKQALRKQLLAEKKRWKDSVK